MTVTGFAKDLKPVTVRLTVTGGGSFTCEPQLPSYMSCIIVLDFFRSHYNYWQPDSNWISSYTTNYQFVNSLYLL